MARTQTMTEYVYVGRHRHPVKVLVYQLVTLGIYGRVLLYKMLREFDGHEALFLDRRPYIFLLILPFVGPFLVKRRVAHLVEGLVRHDVTAKVPTRRRLILIALIPLAPWYHWIVQKALNHHWKMHTKEEELALKQAQLAALERKSRTKENLEAAIVLRKEVSLRAKELEDLKAAALALRGAEEVRRAAEAELARSGAGRRRLGVGMVRKILPAAAFRRRGGSGQRAVSAEEADAEAEPPETGGSDKPPEPDKAEPGEPESGEPEGAPPGAEKPVKKGGLFGFLRRGEPGLSKEERKAQKQRAKEEKRARKDAEKEAKRLEKEQAAAAKEKGKPAASRKDAAGAAKPKGKKAGKKAR
ncbi:MAG: hypothetical protein HYT80_07370 [Euryarchaeota archaeon]|nr:hypothetical protein [Euryarchaeota archaeon]